MKNQVLAILGGVILSVAIMAILFYFFLFSNPIGIYQTNTLKWIPVLITGISLYFSGRINRNTSLKFLPILLIPLIILKLFNFTYFPFIIIIFIVAILVLTTTRKKVPLKYRRLSLAATVGIFGYFLFTQPLILAKEGFGYADNGELINANVLWDFIEEKELKLPSHLLRDKNNATFDLKNVKGKTYLITFWATWCAPCIKEKPELENLKKEFESNPQVEFIDISFDNVEKKWFSYIENSQPLGLQLISEDQQKTSRALNFEGIPTHFIVNPNGTYQIYKSFHVAKTILQKSFNTNISRNKSKLEKLDKYLSSIDSKNEGMGSISIFQNGEEIYSKSFGYSSIDNQIKSNNKTKYRIGSITKTFTATIIMQLVDEGKLSLDTKLDKFFPQIPNAANITIESLLRHRSGLYDITQQDDLSSWMENPQTQKNMLDRFIINGINFKVNERKEYSSTNYILLSFIAEAIENTTYAEILQTRIAEPCNLKDTYFGGKINTSKNEALSYIMEEKWELATETDMSVTTGAGGIISTPTDLNAFFYQLFHENLVSDSSLVAMTKIIDGVGVGLSQFPFPGKFAYAHPGSIDGFSSVTVYFPGEDLVVSYIINGEVVPFKETFFTALNIFFTDELPTTATEN